QMGLEDLAMFRAVHGSTVLYPCDANQTVRLVADTAGLHGIRYLRTTRGGTPVVYSPDERFPVGGSKVLRRGDQATIVTAGITVHEALAAADLLQEDGIAVTVIDTYSIKPIDTERLQAAAAETGRIVTVEDHWPEGGLGDAVLEALATTPVPVVKLAVSTLPGSATPQEQLEDAGIDRHTIRLAVQDLVKLSNG